MANWIKGLSDASGITPYYNINTMEKAYVAADSSGSISIVAKFTDGGTEVIRTGFTSIAAAQTVLDNAIPNLGGSV